MSDKESRMMFRDVGRFPLVSLHGPLIVAGVGIVGVAMWRLATQGTPLPLSVFWAPLMAFTTWADFQTDLDWPDTTLRTFRRLSIAGVVIAAIGLGYGLWEWRWHGGEPWFAVYALLCVIVVPLGTRRRMRRAADRAHAA